MVDVIHALAGACSLAVVSSNSTATIRRLLTRANIAHCFSHVFGGDVEPDKRAVVRRFLADRSYLVNRDCSPAYREGHTPAVASASDLVLITDTTGDVKHAVECGVRAVGVSWGMHSESELLAAGAEFVAVWPQEIIAAFNTGRKRSLLRRSGSVGLRLPDRAGSELLLRNGADYRGWFSAPTEKPRSRRHTGGNADGSASARPGIHQAVVTASGGRPTSARPRTFARNPAAKALSVILNQQRNRRRKRR